MTALISSNVQVLRNPQGQPAFAVLAWEDYEALARQTPAKDPGIPADVVDLALDHDWSAARAWREHLQLTQTQVAQGMGITQGAYAQLEPRKKIRKSSREKIAAALGLHESQLDF